MTRGQLAEIDGAVGTYEADRTDAQSGTVARGAVATRVMNAAVGRGAGATGKCGWTRAAVIGHQVGADTAVETRSRRTLVDVRFAVGACIVDNTTSSGDRRVRLHSTASKMTT